MGNLQIFDLSIALDAFEINDGLFAFFYRNVGIFLHGLIEGIAEGSFLDDESDGSLDGTESGCCLLVGSDSEAFFFQIFLYVSGNPVFVDEDGSAVRKHQGKAEGEGSEKDVICPEIQKPGGAFQLCGKVSVDAFLLQALTKSGKLLGRSFSGVGSVQDPGLGGGSGGTFLGPDRSDEVCIL